MANMNFGVNILPKANNTYSLGNSDYKWNIFANSINGTAVEDITLPAVTSSNNGQILQVSNGAWTVGAASSGLPSVTSSDNGKILQVSSGTWVAAILSVPTKVSDLTNDSGFITSAAIPTNISTFTNDAGYLTSHQDISGKANSADLATVATSGDYGDLLNKPDLSVYLTTVPTMVGATSSAAGTAGLAPAPTSADIDKFLAGDGTYKSGGLPMVILSYGNSTWNDFITAYNNHVIVYCRASSNSNPASGSQTRMAFMAYVNNATTPTEVEFQYYRSMSSHSATAMGDQVFVYKITNKGVWSVTTRDASIKEINVATGSKLGVSWSSNKVTLSNTMTAEDMPISTSDSTKVSASLSSLSTAIETLANYQTITDWNNFKPTNANKATRLYGVSIGGTASNSPFSGDDAAFYGYVEGYPTYCTQHLTAQYSTTAGNRNRTFIRSYLGSAWTNWMELEPKTSWETVTITLDSTRIISGSVTCVKKDGLAFVYFSALRFANAGNNQAGVITGLPKALVQGGGLFTGENAAKNAEICAAGDGFWLPTNSTSMNIHIGSTYGYTHWGNLIYPCE